MEKNWLGMSQNSILLCNGSRDRHFRSRHRVARTLQRSQKNYTCTLYPQAYNSLGNYEIMAHNSLLNTHKWDLNIVQGFEEFLQLCRERKYLSREQLRNYGSFQTNFSPIKPLGLFILGKNRPIQEALLSSF